MWDSNNKNKDNEKDVSVQRKITKEYIDKYSEDMKKFSENHKPSNDENTPPDNQDRKLRNCFNSNY